MKIHGSYVKHLFNNKHQSELTLLIPNYRHTQLLNDLSDDKVYEITITERKQKRSIEQNKLLWALIRELSLKTRENDWELYIKLLESANATFDYVWAKEETESTLKKSFRAIKRIKPHRIKESDGWLYKCYVGSSKFTVEEMNTLLDTLMMWCEEEGIDTSEQSK